MPPAMEQVVFISPANLYFDHKNPRLAEFGIRQGSPENRMLDILWDNMDVFEIVQSIAASGFFKHEPLIVVEENGKNIVIEGNRRLAAVKVLTTPDADRKNIPALSDDVTASLSKLPVIISTRKDAWRYLGFKHVNGPAKWSGYAKARYIADIHNNYGVSLDDIASQIGDGHKTVQRLFRGLMVLEQAERVKAYDVDDRMNKRFAFSHLYTGLDYEGISSFLSLKSETEDPKNPVPKDKKKELGEFFTWLYGSKRQNIKPVIISQNPDLRRLDEVLKNLESIAALRAGVNLEQAFEISRPVSTRFQEALLSAKRALSAALSVLPNGDDKSMELLKIAGSIANTADTIYREMERRREPVQKQRVAED